jgi:hypothetical protein
MAKVASLFCGIAAPNWALWFFDGCGKTARLKQAIVRLYDLIWRFSAQPVAA